MELESPVFKNNEKIPAFYTADGDNINPLLKIKDIPPEAKNLVLIIDDPDSPSGTWTHWVVFNIPPNTSIIKEDSIPGVQGMNDFKITDYSGPSPPHGEHRYFFKLFALDKKLDLGEGELRENVEKAMEGHIISKAELIGVYSR